MVLLSNWEKIELGMGMFRARGLKVGSRACFFPMLHALLTSGKSKGDASLLLSRDLFGGGSFVVRIVLWHSVAVAQVVGRGCEATPTLVRL